MATLSMTQARGSTAWRGDTAWRSGPVDVQAPRRRGEAVDDPGAPKGTASRGRPGNGTVSRYRRSISPGQPGGMPWPGASSTSMGRAPTLHRARRLRRAGSPERRPARRRAHEPVRVAVVTPHPGRRSAIPRTAGALWRENECGGARERIYELGPRRGEPHGRLQGATDLQGMARSKPSKPGGTARTERVRDLASPGRRQGASLGRVRARSGRAMLMSAEG